MSKSSVADQNFTALLQVDDHRLSHPVDLQGVQERHISAAALPVHGQNHIFVGLGRQRVGAAVRDGVDSAGDVNDGAAHRRAHFGHIDAAGGGRTRTDLEN